MISKTGALALLDKCENIEGDQIFSSAYNYLIDHSEGLTYHSVEAQRLISLCVLILEKELEKKA